MAEPGTAGGAFAHRIRVRYSDCDPQAVVFNATYLAYVDEAVLALLREVAGGYRAIVERGLDYVAAEATVRFLAPVRFEDELAVGVEVTRLGTTGMSTRHAFVRAGDAEAGASGAGERVAEAALRYVWLDTATGAKTAIPDWLREALAPHVVDP